MSLIDKINSLLEDLRAEIETKDERIAELENKTEDLQDLMSNEQIIGCTVAKLYSPCVQCEYADCPVCCVEYRNKFEADVTMGHHT